MVRNGQNTWVGMGFAPGSRMTNADMTFCQNREGRIFEKIFRIFQKLKFQARLGSFRPMVQLHGLRPLQWPVNIQI